MQESIFYIYELQVGFVRIKNHVKMDVVRAMELSGSKKHLVLSKNYLRFTMEIETTFCDRSYLIFTRNICKAIRQIVGADVEDIGS